MNANQLLEHMKNGAKLRHMGAYKNRRGTPYRLTLPSGEVIWIQGSTIKPLIRDGNLNAVRWSGWTDYLLSFEVQPSKQ